MIHYTLHSVHLFDSTFKIHPKSIYFLPLSLLPCAKLLFSPIGHLVPCFHFCLSTVSFLQRNKNYSFKIKIRTSHSIAQNLPVTLVWPSRPCMICSLAHTLMTFSTTLSLAYSTVSTGSYLRAFALAWNPLYLDKL